MARRPRTGAEGIPISTTRRVLMLAHAFPPALASGAARPAMFARRLGEHGWRPLVVTQRGFTDFPEPPGGAAPPGVDVIRVSREDLPARFRGLPRSVAWPLAALRAVRRNPDARSVRAVWATFPPSIGIYPGLLLAATRGVPLVLDLRDPWTYGFLWDPKSRLDRLVERRIERLAIGRAARVVVTSPLTAAILRRRHPGAAGRITTITNGISAAPAEPLRDAPDGVCVFRYLGALEPGIRDPRPLLEGYRRARLDPGFAAGARLEFVGGLGPFADAPAAAGVAEAVDDRGRVDFETSRRLMRGADALVVLQTIDGPGRDVISGKAFECLAAARPVLAVCSPDGGDAWLLRRHGDVALADFRDPEAVAAGFLSTWRRWREDPGPVERTAKELEPYDEGALTARLARILDDIAR
jgi:glycosyltransferase involved in cell wall biosynthesis